METEEQGGQVGWQKNVDDVGQRVIVVCDKSIRSGDGMLPACVVTRERRVGMMENIAMENIAQDLTEGSASPSLGDKGYKLTSRKKRPLIRSIAIAQGIGRLVLILRALRKCRSLVKTNSTQDCRATPSSTLPVLTRAVLHHLPFLPPCSSPIGSADSPCSFALAARVGVAPSKARKAVAGRIYNKTRMPKVPSTSTLSGELDKISVDQIT